MQTYDKVEDVRGPAADADPTSLETIEGGPTLEAAAPMPNDDTPDYGVDAPGIVFLFGVAGAFFLVVAIASVVQQGAVAGIGPLVAAVLSGAAAAFMIRSSRVAKPAIWREQLDGMALKGSERVLDIGCGRGLVAVELAKRLPAGEVVGVDVWRSRDLSGNSRANAERNLEIEGVADRVEIVDADAVDLPFGDGEFDVVTAGLALHSIAVAAGRRDAMHEIMRVTKPGGRIVIIDSGKTNEFKAWLDYGEWDDVVRTRPSLATYLPVRTLTATKPRRRKGGKGGR